MKDIDMKAIRIVTLFILILSILIAFTGCSFTAGEGSIRGVVYYTDQETIVENPWVAIYEAATPDIIYILVQGDELGRYDAFVPVGNYIALGSTSQAGPFTGLIDTPFDVIEANTTVKTIVIEDEAP